MILKYCLNCIFLLCLVNQNQYITRHVTFILDLISVLLLCTVIFMKRVFNGLHRIQFCDLKEIKQDWRHLVLTIKDSTHTPPNMTVFKMNDLIFTKWSPRLVLEEMGFHFKFFQDFFNTESSKIRYSLSLSMPFVIFGLVYLRH